MDKKVLEDLVEKNLSQRQIAVELGLSQSTIEYWVTKHGIKTHYKKTNSGISLFTQLTELGIKTCSKCKTEKAISEFYITTKNSKPVYASRCKECQRVVMRGKIKSGSIKQEFATRLGGKCVICGYDRCLRALEFHHRNPNEKEYRMSDLVSWGKIKREEAELEISKCALLCANCHREIHAGLVQLPNQEKE